MRDYVESNWIGLYGGVEERGESGFGSCCELLFELVLPVYYMLRLNFALM